MHNVMKNILRFIFILFLIFLSLPIFSRSYAFRGLSVTEGLSDLVVNAIYKDSLGYVWLGPAIRWNVLMEFISSIILFRVQMKN